MCLPEHMLCTARPLLAGAHAVVGGARVIGQVGAAFEVVLAEAGALEPAAHHLHMGRLAVVRGAGDGNLLIGHRMALGGTGLDQRQHLHGLDGRARIDDPVRLAPALHEAPRGIDQRGIDQMPAFDRRAARAFDHQRPSPFRLHPRLDRASPLAGARPYHAGVSPRAYPS